MGAVLGGGRGADRPERPRGEPRGSGSPAPWSAPASCAVVFAARQHEADAGL